ncbi:NADPH-dependent FMN reductase [Neomicrococcus aestuarii]|uniref:NADPH-dependent FMN reductase-like domain-containing protein n=1 Tax=Neomicrococcus aestuarii TaxID=556325 RepID=A0A1L2ZPX6_9MICC|nr:NADPH-dependent FMN reductase [Neomicrococcus aestuarii]APF41217.1 hypothetical protein BHE16_09690 [Neomicrococcus aestuarii]
MTETRVTTIRVIIASTRPVRVGPQIAEEVVRIIGENPQVNVEVTDLKELNLPFLDEPEMPALGNYVHEHTKNWSGLIKTSDAVVIVTAEYNWGYPASLKNAIDYLYSEWRKKPILLVSYGAKGGPKAAEQLRQVLGRIRANVLEAGIQIPLNSEVDYGKDNLLNDAAAVVGAHAQDITAAVGELVATAQGQAEAKA